jgi:hypothetical protein
MLRLFFPTLQGLFHDISLWIDEEIECHRLSVGPASPLTRHHADHNHTRPVWHDAVLWLLGPRLQFAWPDLVSDRPWG